MRKILISLCTIALSSTVFASEDKETVAVWSVDYKGKPPFKRTIKRVPVSDVAQLEEQQEMVAVKVKRGSKPPFKRSTELLPVADVAQFETVDDKPKTDFRGKATL